MYKNKDIYDRGIELTEQEIKDYLYINKGVLINSDNKIISEKNYGSQVKFIKYEGEIMENTPIEKELNRTLYIIYRQGDVFFFDIKEGSTNITFETDVFEIWIRQDYFIFNTIQYNKKIELDIEE